jgi:LacI family transcriptional regulator
MQKRYIGSQHCRLFSTLQCNTEYFLTFLRHLLRCGEDAVRMLVEKNIPFDAIFCFTEMSALGAKNYLQATGGRIPQNVSIACMSGTELSKLVYPTITAVEQPVELMAETASKIIIEKLESPAMTNKTIVLDAETVYRESTL